MEKTIHDLATTNAEKQYLLSVSAQEFINELSTKDILISTLKDFVVINNISLLCLYNILFVVVALYFPNSLIDNHNSKLETLAYLRRGFDVKQYYQVKIQMTVLTGYQWEENPIKTYKYSIQFSTWGYNTVFIFMDEVVSFNMCVEHINTIDFNKEQNFNEWLINMLLLYNDFVDTLFKHV
jgi:hypothetical protein